MTIKKHNIEKDIVAIVVPEPDAEGLTTLLEGVDATGAPAVLPVVTERPLTIYLNRQEIVTTMTVGDQPQEMAVGFLFNQNMLLSADDPIIPLADLQHVARPENLSIEVAPYGGHVGFIKNWRLQSWLDERLIELLTEEATKTAKPWRSLRGTKS